MNPRQGDRLLPLLPYDDSSHVVLGINYINIMTYKICYVSGLK